MAEFQGKLYPNVKADVKKRKKRKRTRAATYEKGRFPFLLPLEENKAQLSVLQPRRRFVLRRGVAALFICFFVGHVYLSGFHTRRLLPPARAADKFPLFFFTFKEDGGDSRGCPRHHDWIDGPVRVPDRQ